jgi:GNAT superfamily N-acetyltransferase
MTAKQIIRKADRKDLAALLEMTAMMRNAKDANYFELNFDEQDKGLREIFIITHEGQNAGYCILNWNPKYGYFRTAGIPETQDLNVLPSFRRKGLATVMIEFCENRARDKGHELMGISVGLHGGFGAAQILYAKLGYIPDGNGITYDRKMVSSGEFRPVDDNLCLMMVKQL